jgi:Zn-dependent protease with chaperone function
MRGPDIDRQIARQSRSVAIVLAVTMIGWMGAQWLGGEMGWDVRYAFLFDLAAMAAFFWALVVTYQIWRKRRNSGSS